MSSSLRDKMLSVMEDLNRDVAEREELIEAIAIALLTRKNLFILGDPGQAKSFVINGFRSRITGARQFERLLTKQADEEQLFGRVDLSSLIPGQVPQSVLEQDATYRRLRGELEDAVKAIPDRAAGGEAYARLKDASEELNAYQRAVAALHRSEPMVLTVGKIPEADICFLDEVFKCNDGVLNSLLTALNERKYTNEGRTYAIPVISFFAASNEVPNFNDPQEKILAGFTFPSKELRQREARFERFLKDANITLLEDEVRLIDEAFYLGGRKDPDMAKKEHVSRLSAGQLLSPLDHELPILLMDHQPRRLSEAQEAGVDLLLSGHTHNGQMFPANLIVRLFWENPWGIRKKGTMTSAVTSGAGVWGPAMRIGTDSEVMILHITFDK